jgi:hypothetical protein
MLDRVVFDEYLGEFGIYYGRSFSSFVKAVWYKYLNTHLNTEQFILAVEEAWLSQREMPTAKELVQLAQKKKEVYNN